MKILAIDLGKFKSVACDFDVDSGQHAFRNVRTRPQDLHDLTVECTPDRVVIEIGAQAGWIQDLCQSLELEIQIANPNHEGWRWKNVKRKTDRDDALKLAKLSAVDQLPTVTLPPRSVRQWRALIEYRTKLVSRRTAIKNHIRSLIDRQGLQMPVGQQGWLRQAIKQLQAMARPLEEVSMDELWRGQLQLELTALGQVEQLIDQVETKLNGIATADERVERLQTIPGVGPRLAETLVAVIDDPKRFSNRKQVASYVGLVPRQYESGTMTRQGRITGSGHKLLRTLLVEVSWVVCRHNPPLRSIFDQVTRDSKTRRKIGIIALARRLLIICWAMLRDGTCWRPEAVAA